MDLIPDLGMEPGFEASPAGHTTATAHLLGQIFPRDTGLENEENPGEDFAIVQGWPPSFGTRRPLGKERFNLFPEIIRQEGLSQRTTLHEKSFPWGRSPISIIRRSTSSEQGFVRRSKVFQMRFPHT
jgi:hypothetical protein